MKPSTGLRELEGLTKEDAPEPRTHVIWCWKEEIDTVFEAEKRALIESGRAGKNDRFVVFAWPRGDEGPDGAAAAQQPVQPERSVSD